MSATFDFLKTIIELHQKIVSTAYLIL